MTALAVIDPDAEDIAFDVILPAGECIVDAFLIEEAPGLRDCLFAWLRASGFPIINTARRWDAPDQFPLRQVDLDLLAALDLCGAKRLSTERLPDGRRVRFSWA